MSEQPLLAVEGLSAYYGTAQCLHDVSFEMGRESVAIIGRNGMGKTTLCAALMGLSPPRTSGSLKFEGKELLGRPSYKIARAGIGYVPQGRRLFPSLTVDEHLKISARNGADGGWTIARIYELFPRLADRRKNGGAQLSGGEQQMLAIGRALLGNPKLLIMDEPSEGLAPTIVDMPHRHVPAARAGRARHPARRAEPRRGHLAGEAAARHGGWRDRSRDDGRGARGRRRAAEALPRRRAAGTLTRPTLSHASPFLFSPVLPRSRCRPPAAAASPPRAPSRRSPSSPAATATTPSTACGPTAAGRGG